MRETDPAGALSRISWRSATRDAESRLAAAAVPFVECGVAMLELL
jgi:hypothetical protein